MKFLTRSDAEDAELGIAERSAYMLGNAGTALINTINASFVMFYYTDIIGLKAGIVGSILLFSRIFDGITDIIMGIITDHTHSKLGKGRVWILRMCVPFALSGILMMSVPCNTSEIFQYTYVFLTYNLCNSVCLTALYVPYNSMTYSLSSRPYERGILGVFVMFGAVFGTMFVNSTIDTWTKAMGNTAAAWRNVTIVYAMIGLTLHLICFFFTKERYQPDQENNQKNTVREELKSVLTNRYWLLAVGAVFLVMMFTGLLGSTGMYYAKAVLGSTADFAAVSNTLAVTQIVALLVSFVPMKKIGKRNTILAGLFLISLGSMILYFTGADLRAAVFCNAIRGIGAGLAGACGYGLVADTIDYGEWKSGIAASGIGMSSLTFVTKVSGGLSVSLVGMMIDRCGYEASAAVQAAPAVSSIHLFYTLIPMIFTLLAIILLLFYQLDGIYPKIRRELNERKLKGAK